MAAQLDPLTPLTVHIRSPTLEDSISVTTSLDATIIAFKRALQNVHPARPDPADQRLIYQGKLLTDNDVLNVVLKKSDLSTEPIFHLVVKPSSTSTSAPHAYPSDLTNQLRQRHAFTSTPAQYQQQVFTPGNVYPAQPAFSSWPALQQPLTHPAQLQMQQVIPGYQYVVINGQPYLAPVSYPQPSVYSYAYPTPTPTQPLAHTPNTDPAIAAYHQYYHDLIVRYAQQQQQQLAAAAAAVPQNALAAPVVPAVADNNNPVALAERHARRRSAVSLAIKLIFMLFVLGRGASIERVIVLHFIALIIFLYRTGRLRFVVRRVNVGGAREERDAPAPPQPGPVPQPHLQPAATPRPQNPNGGAGPAEPSAEQPAGPAEPAQPPPPAPVSPLRQIEHALYTFVTSLIPSVPDQAAAEQQDMGGF